VIELAVIVMTVTADQKQAIFRGKWQRLLASLG